MVYPNFKDKHLHEALFNPKDFAKYKKWNPQFHKINLRATLNKLINAGVVHLESKS